MQKRLFQPALIIIVLVMLTGCASIKTRASSCQQMLANRNELPRKERLVLMTLDQMAQGGLAPPAAGQFPCKYVPTPCAWNAVLCDPTGHVAMLTMHNDILDGEIPPELGSLSQLVRLDLSASQLSGEIPTELGSLLQLGSLNLADNQLTGPIPPELGELSKLSELSLEGNQLSGSLPPELINLSQLQYVFLANNTLCIPRTAEFEAWMADIEYNDFDQVPYCE